MRVFAWLMLIAALSAGNAKAQVSLTVFTAANRFCEKARLGMAPIAAYEGALDYVITNRFFDPDYVLPNWRRAVSGEMNRLCQTEYKKLIKAFDARAKIAAAKAAEKARWDALPEATKAAHREKEEAKQRKIKADIEASLAQEKAKAKDDYCAKECDECLRRLSKKRSWCSSYVSDYPYQAHGYPDRFRCSCD